MVKKELLMSFWGDVASQNATALSTYFVPNATIRWNNTNEQFTVEEYIIANCEYPGKWCSEVERMEFACDTVITVARVWLLDNSVSFHVTSFFEFQNEKILSLNEYWGDDGKAPQWRIDKKIGRQIK